MALSENLKPSNQLLRKKVSEDALEQLKNAPDFHKKIIFNHVAYFWLIDFVNKQNSRIWCKMNPKELKE